MVVNTACCSDGGGLLFPDRRKVSRIARTSPFMPRLHPQWAAGGRAGWSTTVNLGQYFGEMQPFAQGRVGNARLKMGLQSLRQIEHPIIDRWPFGLVTTCE